MRFRSIIGWAVFFSIVAVIARVLPNPRATYYFFQGKNYFYAQEYEAAIGSYQKSVDADPSFARGYVELGSTYYALDKYPEAEVAFKNAITAQDDSCARCGLGMIYRLTNHPTEAEAELRKSIQLNSRDWCPYDQLGRLYYDKKQYAQAIVQFEQKSKLKPDAVTYHFLANSNYKLGRVKESLPLYQQAIDLSGDSDDLFVDQARAYNDLGRVADATKSLERAIEVNPENEQAHAYLGVTRFLQKDRDGAMKEYRWLLPKNPSVAAQLKRSLEELEEEAQRLGKSSGVGTN